MIGHRFREILLFWWRHLGPLFLVTAPFALITEATQWVFGPSFVLPETEGAALQFSGISLAIILLVRPLAEGALYVQLSAISNGKPRGLLACTAPALLVYPPLLLSYALMAIGVSLGWMALFFPAAWVYTRLCYAPLLVVLKQQNPIAALRQSFQMTQSQQWPLLLVLVLVFLAYLMMSSGQPYHRRFLARRPAGIADECAGEYCGIPLLVIKPTQRPLRHRLTAR